LEKRSYNLTDEAIRLILQGEETVESCQIRYGNDWLVIGGPVKVALQLNELGVQERSELLILPKERVWQKLAVKLTAPDTHPLQDGVADGGKIIPLPTNYLVRPTKANSKKKKGWQTAWLTKVAASLLIFVLVSSIFVGAAQASEPGDLLYDAKLGFDRWDEYLSFSNAAKADARQHFAAKRLDEIERAVRKGSYAGLDKTFSSYQQAIDDSLKFANDSQKPVIESEIKNNLVRLQTIELSANLPEKVKTELTNLASNDSQQLSINTQPVPVTTKVIATPTATEKPVIVHATIAPTPTLDSPKVVQTTKETATPIAEPIPTVRPTSSLPTVAVTSAATTTFSTSTSQPPTQITTPVVVTTTQPPTATPTPESTTNQPPDRTPGTPQSPPGQAKTTPAPQTPPGQVKTPPGPPQTPPGQNKTPH